MKKLLVLLLAVLALPLLNLVIAPDTSTVVPKPRGDLPGWEQVRPILAKKCVSCHAVDAPLPYYARLPLVSRLLASDVRGGLTMWNASEELTREGSAPVAETTLAKLESALQTSAMPPLQYLLMHWNHRLGADEKRTLGDFAARTRAKYFATPGVAAAFAAGALQPLPEAPALSKDKVALGDRLFHDKRLSKDDTISCASCHALEKGGTDQLPVSVGINKQKGGINSPTVFNAGLQYKQFWDGRAADLFAQADGPVNNPIEMGANWKDVIEKLKKDEALTKLMAAVYPDGFSDKNLRDAIAVFEQSLITPAPFDAFLRGDAAAISSEAKLGLEAFTKRGCAMCHVGKVLGGQSFERMGVFKDYFAGRTVGAADLGRFSVTKEERDRHKFKVPMLRNIAVTQPYFHDGSATTLDKAVEVMAAHQLEDGIPAVEQRQIVAFLMTLTGSYQGKRLQ
jgi:cytochrome c peroxidase